MKKDIQNMSDHELLAELVQEKRALEKLHRIWFCADILLLALVIILAAVYIPRIMAPIRQIQSMSGQMQAAIDRFNGSMDSFDTLSEQALDLFGQLQDMDLPKLRDNVEQLSEQAAEFFRQIQALNLPKLQESAEQFNGLVSRITALFGLG